jgi:hypothetical protein
MKYTMIRYHVNYSIPTLGVATGINIDVPKSDSIKEMLRVAVELRHKKISQMDIHYIMKMGEITQEEVLN